MKRTKLAVENGYWSLFKHEIAWELLEECSLEPRILTTCREFLLAMCQSGISLVKFGKGNALRLINLAFLKWSTAYQWEGSQFSQILVHPELNRTQLLPFLRAWTFCLFIPKSINCPAAEFNDYLLISMISSESISRWIILSTVSKSSTRTSYTVCFFWRRSIRSIFMRFFYGAYLLGTYYLMWARTMIW